MASISGVCVPLASILPDTRDRKKFTFQLLCLRKHRYGVIITCIDRSIETTLSPLGAGNVLFVPFLPPRSGERGKDQGRNCLHCCNHRKKRQKLQNSCSKRKGSSFEKIRKKTRASEVVTVRLSSPDKRSVLDASRDARAKKSALPAP